MRGIFVATAVLAALAAPASSAAKPKPKPARYLVGAAARTINPEPDGTFAGKPVYLGGYGIASPPVDPGRPATGFLGDGLHVRAFAVSDGEHAAAIADIESQGWFVAQRDAPYGLLDMRRAVEERTGGVLKASAVVVQSDHSHGGPDGLGVWGGVPVEYRKLVFDRTVDAIVEAYRTRREGRLYYGTAPGRDLLSNQFDYDKANEVVDSDVRVLQARDRRGRPFVTLLDFSAHATVLGSGNTKATGDWVQAANPLLAKHSAARRSPWWAPSGARSRPTAAAAPPVSRATPRRCARWTTTRAVSSTARPRRPPTPARSPASRSSAAAPI